MTNTDVNDQEGVYRKSQDVTNITIANSEKTRKIAVSKPILRVFFVIETIILQPH